MSPVVLFNRCFKVSNPTGHWALAIRASSRRLRVRSRCSVTTELLGDMSELLHSATMVSALPISMVLAGAARAMSLRLIFCGGNIGLVAPEDAPLLSNDSYRELGTE